MDIAFTVIVALPTHIYSALCPGSDEYPKPLVVAGYIYTLSSRPEQLPQGLVDRKDLCRQCVEAPI